MSQRIAYEFFDHTADIGVHVFGATREELFQNAARALYEVMGTFAFTHRGTRRTLNLRAESAEELLHDWLAELLYDVEARQIYYDEVEIHELSDKTLRVSLFGGKIDFEQSQPNCELKAVTYHQLHIEQSADGRWQATVIFDV